MNDKNYIIAKANINGETVIINYDKINGLKLSPKNSINYPGIKVNSMILIKPSFIEKILKRKIKNKLNHYLNYIISLIDDDDSSDASTYYRPLHLNYEEEDGSNYKEALDDLTRYKSIVEYKYRKFLDDKYITLLLKKIAVLENEIKSKSINKSFKNNNKLKFYEEYNSKNEENYEEKGKSR